MLKGFLIILVVAGHAIGKFYPYTFNYKISFKLIYSFHMFLFILISGFLISYRNKKIDFIWIKKRFSRLMVPYFVWTLIYNFIGHNFTISSYILYCIKPSFWYLIILFLCDCFLLLNSYLKKFGLKNDIMYYAFISVVMLIMYYLTINIVEYSEIIKMLAIYIPYYFLGVYLGENYYKLKKYEKNNKKYIFIVLYIMSMFLYTYKDNTKFIEFFAFTNLPTSILKIACTFYNHYVVAILGIISFAIIMDIIKNIRILEFVKKIGKYTLPIYLISSRCFIGICDIQQINIYCSIFLGVIIPIVLYKICARSKILKTYLFGENVNKK